MNSDQLLAHFSRITDAPDAIQSLRSFILNLAVRGKLIEQDPNDEPASQLLTRIQSEKARMVKKGEIRKQETAPINKNEEPFEIPATWAWTRLGQIGDWGSGSTPSRGNYEFFGGGITWLKSGELNDNQQLLGSEETVSELAISKGSFRLNQPGDILIAMYGATIGKLAILAERAVTNQAVCGCTPFSGVLNLFLFNFLLSQRKQLQSASEGGAQPNISKIKILGFAFPLPPLAEQYRIVAKVDELMDLCDRLESLQRERESRRDRLTSASLHRLNQPSHGDASAFRKDASFFLKILGRTTTRPDHIRNFRNTILNLAVRGKLLSTSSPSTQPKMLGDVATLQNGYAFKSEWFAGGGVRLLRNANVSHGVIRWDDVAHLPEKRIVEFERFQLNEGDIVLSLDRPFIVSGTKVARVRSSDLPSLLLQRVGRFQLIPDCILPDYLFLWLHSPHFTSQIDPGRSNGVPHISSKQVEAAEIFVPSLIDQQHIVAKVEGLLKLCDKLESQLATTQFESSRLLEAVLHEALFPSSEEIH